VLSFLYDFLIYSKNEKEHEEHLKIFFQVLRENKLYEKISKCDFHHKQIRYLGHIILKEGMLVDPKKIEAKMN